MIGLSEERKIANVKRAINTVVYLRNIVAVLYGRAEEKYNKVVAIHKKAVHHRQATLPENSRRRTTRGTISKSTYWRYVICSNPID